MTNSSIQRQAAGLLAWLAVCVVAATLGGFASANAAGYYEQLMLPAWAPPPWLFAPVWTLLYVLMGVAAWLVWRERGFGQARAALSLFLIQLAVNALWTWLFFAWHQGSLAFIEILVLWAIILCTVVAFWLVRPMAAALLIPYLAWVTFAAVLTYAVWQANPTLLA